MGISKGCNLLQFLASMQKQAQGFGFGSLSWWDPKGFFTLFMRLPLVASSISSKQLASTHKMEQSKYRHGVVFCPMVIGDICEYEVQLHQGKPAKAPQPQQVGSKSFQKWTKAQKTFFFIHFMGHRMYGDHTHSSQK